MIPKSKKDGYSKWSSLRGFLPKKEDGFKGVMQAIINYIIVPVFLVQGGGYLWERFVTNPYKTVYVEIKVFDKYEGTDLANVTFTFTDEEDNKTMDLKRTEEAPYIYIGEIEVRKNTDTIDIQTTKRDYTPNSKLTPISLGNSPKVLTSFMLAKKGTSRRFEESLKIDRLLF